MLRKHGKHAKDCRLLLMLTTAEINSSPRWYRIYNASIGTFLTDKNNVTRYRL